MVDLTDDIVWKQILVEIKKDLRSKNVVIPAFINQEIEQQLLF